MLYVHQLMHLFISLRRR